MFKSLYLNTMISDVKCGRGIAISLCKVCLYLLQMPDFEISSRNCFIPNFLVPQVELLICSFHLDNALHKQLNDPGSQILQTEAQN